ncbi:hypothetical protein NM688_g9330 [Phlebia brevispora]|uniref:Uncharacterized protein n=1 Tax=Phlebia brevispora TaxID=194682 RepID=A0ACC1RGW2_9APHY|nr:hypothetical protein NM688_g9330 [Phlebia brevispora]
MNDIILNLDRYYQREFVSKIMAMYRVVPEGAPIEEYEKLFGEISSALQVHLPVRMLARDLVNAGYPVLRYEIRWTPEQIRYVTHGTDRPLWALRIPTLTDEQLMTARQWLDVIARETDALKDKPRQSARDVLVLTEEREIKWMEDIRWEEMMKLSQAVPGEE